MTRDRELDLGYIIDAGDDADGDQASVPAPGPVQAEEPAHDVNDLIVSGKPWSQMEGEPHKWYTRFIRYYLAMGPSRTVKGANREFLRVEQNRAVDYAATPRTWLHIFYKWEWKRRAEAFDQEQNEVTVDTVMMALDILREAAPDAAEALIDGLANARTRVSAAREILDRIGLPAVQRHESVSVRVNADDIRKAREEARDWENQTFGENT